MNPYAVDWLDIVMLVVLGLLISAGVSLSTLLFVTPELKKITGSLQDIRNMQEFDSKFAVVPKYTYDNEQLVEADIELNDRIYQTLDKVDQAMKALDQFHAKDKKANG